MVYYRAEAWSLDGLNPITYYEFEVVRTTPCGVVVKEGMGIKHVRETRAGTVVHKRFAWPTKEDAITSLVRRKRKRVETLEAQLVRALEELGNAESERRSPSWAPKLLPAPAGEQR